MSPPDDDLKVTIREFDARLAEVRRAVDLASGTAQGVDLREYVEALFAEGQRATEMAEREREKAAQALDVERRYSLDIAEREREKAARVQADKFAAQIVLGDQALKDHIEQQISQLHIMLDSIRSSQDKAELASQKAVDKSEISYDKRFEAVNELRAQMGDLIAGHAKTLSALTATLMPREVAESRLKDLGEKVDVNTSRIDRMVGRDGAEPEHRQRSQFAATTLITLAIALVATITLVITLARIVTGH